MSVIFAIISFFTFLGYLVFGAVVLGAAAFASFWCAGFFGSVCAVGLFRTTESRGAEICAPYGIVIGLVLAAWAMFTAGIVTAIFCSIGFCVATLFFTAVTFLLFPPPPLPFGDDGLC